MGTMNKPLNIEPTPDWVGWALMPARLVVAAFLHLEQAMRPDVDPERFGHMFRSADTDERRAMRAVQEFDARHGRGR